MNKAAMLLIEAIPTLSEASVEVLHKDFIDTPQQLVGKFLTLKYMCMSSKRHAELFWWYLHNLGILPSQRQAILDFVGEKANLCFPGTHDPSLLAE